MPVAKKKTVKRKTTKKAAPKKRVTKKAAPKRKVTRKAAPKKKTTKKVAKKKAPAKKKVARKAPAKRKTAKKAPAKRKVTRKAAPKKKVAKKKTTKAKRKPNPAFMKPLTPSAELGAVVGTRAIPRTEVVKKLWAYIKKNKLQDNKNRRNINADDKLKKVFGGKKTVNMFEMTKLVSKHLK